MEIKTFTKTEDKKEHVSLPLEFIPLVNGSTSSPEFRNAARYIKSRGLNKSGVGLGLSIANDIIVSHGGKIILDKSSKLFLSDDLKFSHDLLD